MTFITYTAKMIVVQFSDSSSVCCSVFSSLTWKNNSTYYKQFLQVHKMLISAPGTQAGLSYHSHVVPVLALCPPEDMLGPTRAADREGLVEDEEDTATSCP